jgi:hypothetical protein
VDLDLLFWLLIAGIVVVWVSRSFEAPSQVFSGIWGFREALWPSGVQEDDDAHWSWTRVKRERPIEPEIVETNVVDVDRHRPDDPNGGLPEVIGSHYAIRATVRGQVRSADRARS